MVRATDGYGKTSDRRPCALTREAEELQWQFAYREISKTKYYVKRAKLKVQKKWWR